MVSSGDIESKVDWNKDIFFGRFDFWHQNGVRKVSGQTRDGEVDGEWKTFTHAVCWHQGLSAKWGLQFRRRCGLPTAGNVNVPIWKMAMDGIVNMMKI